jgi:uncharacterized membrane protein
MDAKCIEFDQTAFGCAAISWGLYVSYIIFAVAIISALGLALYNTLKNPGTLVKSAIGIGVLIVVLVISYALSDSEVSTIAKGLGENESSVRWIGAGLIMFYIALFAAIGGLVYSEISKAFK